MATNRRDFSLSFCLDRKYGQRSNQTVALSQDVRSTCFPGALRHFRKPSLGAARSICARVASLEDFHENCSLWGGTMSNIKIPWQAYILLASVIVGSIGFSVVALFLSFEKTALAGLGVALCAAAIAHGRGSIKDWSKPTKDAPSEPVESLGALLEAKRKK